jgi:predicted permease
MESWRADLAHAVRSLLRAPGFTAVTVLTLALAIGANTAIFSVIDAVLLDPLTFPQADRLVAIRGTAPGTDMPDAFNLGAEFFVQYRENATQLEDLGFTTGGQTTVRAGDQVDRLFVGASPPSLYSTLGVEPILGRLPTEQDAEGTIVVISHWLWLSWFGGDEAVIGRAIEVGGDPVTIVGVMPPAFRFPDERISLWAHDLPTEPIRPGGFGLTLIGRLAPDAEVETLSAELAQLAHRLPERFGGEGAYLNVIAQHRPVVDSLEEFLVGDFERPLWILLGTVGIVLLIACANVANLLIVRAESRRADVAVRRALGAERGRLVRGQLAEAMVLSAAGAAGGVVLAWMGVPLLVRAAPENIPGLASATVDGSAWLFTAAVATVAALASGVLPALRFSDPDVSGGLRDTRRVGAGPGHLTRDALVAVQTAAAVVLLVASGLLFQSFRALRSVDPGYETEDIFTFQMAPDRPKHGLVDATTSARFHYDFMDRLAALPGVESVGLIELLPLDEGAGRAPVLAGRAVAPEDAQVLRYNVADGDYFATMGIQFLSGSTFPRSTEPSENVEVIVSRSAAETLWPGEDPLGQVVRPAMPDTMLFAWMTVRGVVEDVMLADFRQREPEPLIYIPVVGRTQESWAVGTPAFVVKTPRAEVIGSEIRELVREIAPEAPMYRTFTMAGLAARSMAQLSFTMLAIAIAAGLALVLGAVGLYGTLSYVVSRRTREIGIRMAVGAQAAQVRRMVMTEGSRVTLVGVAVGLVAAVLLARVLESLLFDIEPVDPATLVGTGALMLAVALAASYLPARRASAMDPVKCLQED